MVTTPEGWSPESWKAQQEGQVVHYPDEVALERVLTQLSQLPPLVTSWEIEALERELGRAAAGQAFLLQGGDCAESFDDCRAEPIAAKLKILLQASLVLVHATKKPVVRVGRMAGQYAKPRSSNTEERAGLTLPTYRGDLINRSGFTSEDRVADPTLLLRGYERAALTLNFVRALAEGGFADLHHPERWDLSFAGRSRFSADYARIVESIKESVAFMEAVVGPDVPRLKRVDFYTSHEALSLRYEQAQTRHVPQREGYYNLSTHMPWIGKRTAELDGAHVEFCRGIQNPLGVKVGPDFDEDWIAGLAERLDPDREPGRLTLIHRFGAGAVERELPRLIACMRREGRAPLYCCDPMHGNTITTESGVKTRRFETILAELRSSFAAHEAVGSHLGGVHFELTGGNVTECIGGARGLEEADLARDYRSSVDPRLNAEQALEMAMDVARHLSGKSRA